MATIYNAFAWAYRASIVFDHHYDLFYEVERESLNNRLLNGWDGKFYPSKLYRFRESTLPENDFVCVLGQVVRGSWHMSGHPVVTWTIYYLTKLLLSLRKSSNQFQVALNPWKSISCILWVSDIDAYAFDRWSQRCLSELMGSGKLVISNYFERWRMMFATTKKSRRKEIEN